MSMNRPVGRRTLALFVLAIVVQSAIVVTGGLVRLTGSGLGCPTWPECAPGSLTPTAEIAGLHAVIEFGNRLLTFVVAVVVLATLVAAWRHRPRRRPLVLLALAQLGGVVLQVVLGGITVLTRLHPATVAAHFLVSMVLIVLAVTLHHRAQEGDHPAQPVVRRELRLLAVGVALVSAAVLVVGTVVTGSGPHSGDAEEPARFALDPRTVSWLHADLVLLLLGLTVGLLAAARATDAPRRVQRSAAVVLAVILAQGALGYVQYLTGVPVPLVSLHTVGACLLVVVVTRLVMATRQRSFSGAQPRSHRIDAPERHIVEVPGR